ncbi:MAG: hypothetical protein SFV32_05680 [Opitutaceae bacterium]|nr:hypothetical protein [Opitutaceae bacterium]
MISQEYFARRTPPKDMCHHLFCFLRAGFSVRLRLADVSSCPSLSGLIPTSAEIGSIIALVFGCVHVQGQADQPPYAPQGSAVWSPARIGGGGYITGLVLDFSSPGRLWARCDVAGVFLSENGGRSFHPMNAGMTASAHHSVQSLAVSPHNSSVLYRCSGEARGGKSFGFIHGSTDGGRSWHLLTEQADYIGNGETRFLGEMIAVDPFDANTVVAASFSRGIFASYDSGRTWTNAGLAGEPLQALVFHPRIPGRVYVGTLKTLAHAEYLFPSGYPRPKVGRLYISDDHGRTWKLLSEGPGMAFAELVIAPDNDDTLYAVAQTNGLLKSTDAGRTFQTINRGLPPVNYNTLAVDPHDAKILYTAAGVNPNASVPVVPLYVSHDAGESWAPLKDYQPTDFTDYPYQAGDIRPIGWAIAKLRVDPFEPETLYMSNWFGASVSLDGGRHWSGNHYLGLENICIENVLADPIRPGTFYYAAADKTIGYSDDDGRTYKHFAELHLPANYYCSTCAAPSRFTSGLVVYGVTNNGSRRSAFYRTVDGGRTVSCSLELPEGLMVQSIREDSVTPGIFLASVDGELEKGSGLYRSIDFGESWQRLPGGGLPGCIERVPQDREWVENELLAVVWYQTKNACGTNQLLAAIPGQPGAFYWGEWTTGVFRTLNGAKTWTDVSSGLPFSRPRPATLVCLVVDPAKPDRVYAGFIGEGLWRSEDGGANWAKLFPRDDRAFNASSIALGGPGADEIYVSCEPLGLSPCRPALLHSTDAGETWTELYDSSLGALRMKTVAVDSTTGTIQVGTTGNGIFRVSRVPAE